MKSVSVHSLLAIATWQNAKLRLTIVAIMCPVGLRYVANYTHNSLHYFYTVQILCIILNSQDHCQNNSLTLEI